MKAVANRLESLDVFRGATIAAMILVNNPGDWNSVFAPLLHAYWIGCTFADLVFPWFVFIMGVAMPFAFARRHERGDRTSQVFGRIAQRVLLDRARSRADRGGELAGSSCAPVPRCPSAHRAFVSARRAHRVDIRRQGMDDGDRGPAAWTLGAARVRAIWRFPGGTLTPEHNLARYLDTLVFGRHALTIPNDPEGLLGTLPAAATALIGAVAGELMRRAADDSLAFGL